MVTASTKDAQWQSSRILSQLFRSAFTDRVTDTWAVLLMIGFTLVQWGSASPVLSPKKFTDFGTYLYMSGMTFITLGFGDVLPLTGFGRLLVVMEAGTGFGFLALDYRVCSSNLSGILTSRNGYRVVGCACRFPSQCIRIVAPPLT